MNSNGNNKGFRFVPRGDAFDFSFSEYHQDERYEKLRENLRDRKFTVGKSGVSYRVINHWVEKNLLPEGCQGENGEWKKFTFVELVWLKAILRLREFGMSLEKLAIIKKEIMKWNIKNNCYPLFEYYVAQAKASDADPYIIVWADGNADVASMTEINNSTMFFSEEDTLLISLKSIISKMGVLTSKSEAQETLSRNEKELIRTVRFEGSKEVKAKINNHEVSEIETIRTYPDTSEMSKIHAELRDNGSFGEITTKYGDGKKQSLQVKKRKKLN